MTTQLDTTTRLAIEMGDLTREVLEDAYWSEQLEKMYLLLDQFDPGITASLSISDPTNHALQRIVRFCIPLFEISKESERCVLGPFELASMFLWQEVWRPLDDILDGDGRITNRLHQYSVSLLRAYSFHALRSETVMGDFLNCLKDNLEVEEDEALRASPHDIYRRVRIYEVILENMDRNGESTRALFRAYINIIGIAHDLVDVIEDLKNGQTTFSTHAYNWIDKSQSFGEEHMASLKATVGQELARQKNQFSTPSLTNCWITKRNIRIYADLALSNQN